MTVKTFSATSYGDLEDQVSAYLDLHPRAIDIRHSLTTLGLAIICLLTYRE